MRNFPSLVEGKQMGPLRFIRLQRGLSPVTDMDFYWARGDALGHPIPTISAELRAITVSSESQGFSWISYL